MEEKSPFLLLPYELRCEIYRFSIIESGRPSAEQVHKNRLSATWEDRPSPLLWLNRQIRAEVSDFLQNTPVTIRITWQDANFDCSGQSAFIAQQRIGSSNLPHVIVEVWPPVSVRPVDSLRIWENLRKIRDKLSQASQVASGVSRFDLVFLENDIAQWSSLGGAPWCWMCYIPNMAREWSQADNDMIYMLALFAKVTNIGEAHIHLPDSLLADGKNMGTRDFARKIEESMMGLSPIAINPIGTAWYIEWDIGRSTWWDIDVEVTEWYLECKTALFARAQLDAMTNNGEFKLSVAEYDEFVTIWPHFDTLEDCFPGGEFKGMWHYTQAPETSESLVSPAALLEELPFYEDSE